MNIQPTLTGSPLGYTLHQVEGLGDDYQSWSKALWSNDRAVRATFKELIFLRSSVVTACPT